MSNPVPVDASLADDLEGEGVTLASVLNAVGGAQAEARHLGACRNNPSGGETALCGPETDVLHLRSDRSRIFAPAILTGVTIAAQISVNRNSASESDGRAQALSWNEILGWQVGA